MFTGIIEELGAVESIDVRADSARITIRGPLVTSDARHGDSIAVNGVCLTVVDSTPETFSADVMAETLRRSALGALEPGARVNLERAASVGDRLGGHIVQGHVDGTGVIVGREPAEHWEVVTVGVPRTLLRYVVEKGSITIDGVSLTVVGTGEEPPRADVVDNGGDLGWLSVSLIPTTLELTTLGVKGVGDPVNIEVDVIAKHVEKLMEWRQV